MKIYSLKFKVYLLKDIKAENAVESIRNLIDQSMLNNKKMYDLHYKNQFKMYSHGSLTPIEPDYIYKAGKIYQFLIRTTDERIKDLGQKIIINEMNDDMKVLTVSTTLLPTNNPISKLKSVTPVVVKFFQTEGSIEEGNLKFIHESYWRNNRSIDEFEEKLKHNLINKYKYLHNIDRHINLDENFEFIRRLSFKNTNYPITTKYKNITLLSDLIEIEIAENKMSQELANIAIATGIGEMGSRGYGFTTYKLEER